MKINNEPDNQQSQRIEIANKALLKEFSHWLDAKGLSINTVRKHVSNIDFYINAYLLYAEGIPPQEGMTSGHVDMFLGYWFIKRASWATPGTLKGNAASLKKFGQFLLERDQIEKTELDSIAQTIKEEMPEWLATVNRWDDPSIEDSEEIWVV